MYNKCFLNCKIIFYRKKEQLIKVKFLMKADLSEINK